MSADNGYIIRQNSCGRFVLQMYWASSDDYPPIIEGDNPTNTFSTLEEAVQYYYADEPYSEYGLTVLIEEEKESPVPMKTEKYVRKPFVVDAVQVTEENMVKVAEWSGGTVTDPSGETGRHIRIDVKDPQRDRQTQAFVGDWVLSSRTGFKVYTNSAFQKSFHRPMSNGPRPTAPTRKPDEITIQGSEDPNVKPQVVLENPTNHQVAGTPENTKIFGNQVGHG